MASLQLLGVTLLRGATTILSDIDLEVDDGEFVGIVGPSGAGKTMLLRVIAGLERPNAGAVAMNGHDMTGVPPQGRDVAMVFQNPSLLPHRDVRGNVAFPLEVRHETIQKIRTRVDAEARALHIEALLARTPGSLAAGEAQLVQIARAMVRVPSVLLLDEPLTRLDAALRQRMRAELRILQRGYGVTTVFTTNDPVEAMSMPDRLVVLHAGKVVQTGAPLEVYRDPVSLEAAMFTGEIDVSEREVTSDGVGYWLTGGTGRERAWAPSLAGHVGGRVVLAARPDGSTLLFDPESGLRLG